MSTDRQRSALPVLFTTRTGTRTTPAATLCLHATYIRYSFALMNREQISEEKRHYTSRLREEQAEQTRERILAAVAHLMRAGDLEELSFAAVAEQAGVSVPTVYRYFPSRGALFDGVQEWVSKELNAPPFPTSWEEFEPGAPALYAYYEKARDLFRTAMVTSLFRDVNQERRVERDRRVASLLSPLTEHLEEREANAIHALFRLMYGFEGYSFMNERFGVNADEASRAVAWATRTLAAQLERERALLESDKKGGASKRPRATRKPGGNGR